MASSGASNSDWIVAVCINLVGSIMINFGTNLIKYSHLRAEQAFLDSLPTDETAAVSPGDAAAKKVSSGSGTRLWWAGVSTFCLGNLLNFVSFSYGSQSQLAALGSVQFVTNVVFAYSVLHVDITRRILVATFTIMFGNTLIVVFFTAESKDYTAQQLLELYTDTAYQWYLGTMAALAVLLQLFYRSLRDKQARHLVLQHRVAVPTPLHHTLQKLVPLSYALVSGIVGTQSVVLAKSSSELLSKTFGGDNQLDEPATYFLVCAWLATMVFWLRRMNSALQKFDAVFIIPVLQVIWIVLSIVSGGIYFQEFDALDAVDAVMFVLGVALIVLGVFTLAAGGASDDQGDAAADHTLEGTTHSRTDVVRLGSNWANIQLTMPMSTAQLRRPPIISNSLRQTDRNDGGSKMLSPLSKPTGVPRLRSI